MEATTTEVHTGWPVRVVPIAGKGRGVIAQRTFQPGELIERAPVIVERRMSGVEKRTMNSGERSERTAKSNTHSF